MDLSILVAVGLVDVMTLSISANTCPRRPGPGVVELLVHGSRARRWPQLMAAADPRNGPAARHEA